MINQVFLNEPKFESFFNNFKEPLGLSCKGIILDCNQEFVKLNGYQTKNDLIGKSVLSLMVPEKQEDIKNYILRRSSGEEVERHHETTLASKDGKKIPVLLNSFSYQLEGEVYSVVLVTDITERKAIENELLISESSYRTIFEKAMDGIFQSTLDGRLLKVNESFAHIYGYNSAEEMLKSISDIPTQIYKDPSYRKVILDELIQQGFIKDKIFTVLNKFGKTVWIQTSCQLIKDSNGTIMYIEGITKDITIQKSLEEEKKQYQENLEIIVKERTSKLEAIIKDLETLSYSISHDLRAPLRTINSFSRILQDEFGDQLDQTGRYHLSKIADESLYMSKLIDSILTFTRLSRMNIQPVKVNLSKIAFDIISEYHEIDPERNYDFICPEDLTIIADKNMMKILMHNLLHNSWKFTSKTKKTLITIGQIEKDQKKVIFIKDNGCGFDMKFYKTLFLPFYKLHQDPDFDGIGIGLTTSKRIIERHHGEIWADSEVNQGCTIYFTLD